ncbi:MAG: glycosyltransferase family 2 protein [Lachnospiraceae bacterium]|nr:glycosyltransferase family 2 protein [Lachnospiraceae bacterium]
MKEKMNREFFQKNEMEIKSGCVVTIIVPAYNAEKTIENCIKSIYSQTYEMIEIIIVDDGSSDNTYDIAGRLAGKDERIRVVRQKNKGASSARNRGIQEATGEFIIFVDADDTIMSNMVETLVNKQKGCNADLVQGAIIRIRGKKDKQILSDRIIHEYKSRREIRKKFFEILENELNSPVGKLYKKDIICENSILFDERLEVSEDLCFNLHYLENIESMVFIPELLYKYYLNNSYLTRKYKKNLFDMRKRAIEVLDDFLNRNGLKRDKIYYLYIKLVFASAMQEIENGKNRRERYRIIKNNLSRGEVREAIDECKPHGYMESVLYYIIKTQNIALIDLSSRVFGLARKSTYLKIRRVSV